MKGTMLTFKTNKHEPEVKPLNAAPDLEMLQKAVGGCIEAVPLFDTIHHDGEVRPCAVFCNEEGKINGLDVNSMATVLWDQALKRAKHPGLLLASETPSDFLVGDVAVIIGDKELLEAL